MVQVVGEQASKLVDSVVAKGALVVGAGQWEPLLSATTQVLGAAQHQKLLYSIWLSAVIFITPPPTSPDSADS